MTNHLQRYPLAAQSVSVILYQLPYVLLTECRHRCCTEFKNHPKSLLRHGEWTTVHQKSPNSPQWSLPVKQCYQTGRFLKGKKLVENAPNEKLKWDIGSHFSTL